MSMLQSGDRITDANRDAWLALRSDPSRPLLGSSQWATALGISPYKGNSPSRLYLQMIGEGTPTAETPLMRRGRYLQGWILGEYERMTDDKITHEEVFFWGPTFHGVRLASTLDAISAAGYAVECKSHGWRIRDAYGAEGEADDAIPLGIYTQMLGQLHLAGLEEARLAAAFDGQDTPAIYPMRYDEANAQVMMERLEKFCWHVARRIPPEDNSDEACVLMPRLYRWEDSQEPAELPGDLAALCAEWIQIDERAGQLQGEVNRLEKRQKEIRAAIQTAMAGNCLGYCGDWTVKVKPINRKESIVKASTYHKFSITPRDKGAEK